MTKKLFNLRLSVALAIYLCLGILTMYSILMTKVVLLVCLSVAGILLSVILAVSENKKHLFSLIFGVCFFVIGLIGFGMSFNEYNNADLGNHYSTARGRVYDVVDTDYGKAVKIKNLTVSENPSDYNLIAYVYGETEISVGDEIELFSKIIDLSAVKSGKFSSSYLSQKIKYQAQVNFDEITVYGNHADFFERTKAKIKQSLGVMDDDSYGVACGLIVGDSTLIEEETLLSFRGFGVAHVFAISGLHIGFMALALTLLFKKIKINGYIKSFIIIAILFLYVGVCGFKSSAVRAFIMTGVYLILSQSGERYDSLSSLGISAIILLVISPVQLFCVGFLLSFSVAFGIIVLSPVIAEKLKFLPRKVSQIISTALSAQIFGIPICTYFFGNFSLLAVFMNVLLIPVIEVVYLLLVFSLIIGNIFSVLSYTLFVPNAIIGVITRCIKALDYSGFIVKIQFGFFAVFYYFAIILLCGIINLKVKPKRLISLSLAVIACLGTVFINRPLASVVVMGDSNYGMALICDKESTLIVSDYNKSFSTYQLIKAVEREKLNHVDNLIILENTKYDKANLITRIYSVVKIKNITYYGDKDFMFEQVVKSSFKIEDFTNYTNQVFTCYNAECTFILGGRGLSFKTPKSKTLILSAFENDNANYSAIENDYTDVIFSNYYEQIEGKFFNSNLYHVRAKSGAESCESCGYIKYFI